MMNFALAREIYGSQPWMVDAISFPSLFSILQDFRNGIKFDSSIEDKLNSTSVLSIESNTKLAYARWQLNDSDEGVIAVHKINGPITKNGGASSYGMKDVAAKMDNMTKDKRVVGHILLSDSGGGSSNAVVFVKDAIIKSQAAGKPVVQLVEKGGLNASAMLYMGSFSDFIYSESEDNLIGSIGTMIGFEGFPKQHTDPNGKIHVRAYATASIHKNEEFEEALKGNLKPLKSNILDPHNIKFMSDIKNNRPNVLESQLSGKTFQAHEVVGTLIDGIGGMTKAINKVLELSNNIKTISSTANTPQNSNNLNNKEMTKTELQSKHPEVYNSIFDAGVTSGIKSEKDRAGAWLAHSSTDIKAVKEGIESGENISATKREEFIVKSASLSHLNNLKNDSKKELKIDESKKDKSNENKEVDSFYDNIDEKLKIKKD